jgi:FkbM family methyltransferase
MFISLKDIVTKFNAKIRGVIHVGAHLLEEKEAYTENNINNIVWIEGNDELIPKCQEILNNLNSSDKILNYLVYDVDGVELEFNITNNTQSSSVLPFGKHKQYYSYIEYIKTLKKKTYTLKTILTENNVDISKYNMLNLDLQGIELRALKGLGDLINNIDYIYTEVNNDTIYEGNDFIADIDSYLQGHGFIRAETFMLSEQWGDALYIRNTLVA